ncbi:hypothetical protein E2C01_049937 [Portunus trituberculatus]|uniref:Uncharacterized protein n=1 Tax=Portunus trituberculatus TaxID=210409 RepID=A0A5B7GFW7_PORTR|nr:hypothetical protein [Portunus trituberculatus]
MGGREGTEAAWREGAAGKGTNNHSRSGKPWLWGLPEATYQISRRPLLNSEPPPGTSEPGGDETYLLTSHVLLFKAFHSPLPFSP